MTPADILLADQHERLIAVIASNAPPEVKNMAWHYLDKVQHWMGWPDAARDLALGELGPNGYGPAIDDVCAQAKFHLSRPVAVQLGRAA